MLSDNGRQDCDSQFHPLLAAAVQLRVEGEGLRTVELSLQDLKTKVQEALPLGHTAVLWQPTA